VAVCDSAVVLQRGRRVPKGIAQRRTVLIHQYPPPGAPPNDVPSRLCRRAPVRLVLGIQLLGQNHSLGVRGNMIDTTLSAGEHRALCDCRLACSRSEERLSVPFEFWNLDGCLSHDGPRWQESTLVLRGRHLQESPRCSAFRVGDEVAGCLEAR